MNISTTKVLDMIDRLRKQGEDFCIVTILRTAAATSAKAGAKAVLTRDGALHGFIGGNCVQSAVRRVGQDALERGEPRLIRVKPKEDIVEDIDTDGVELHKSSCPSGGTVDLFFEPMRQRPKIIVCGTSPVALTLARLAGAIGYQTIVALPGPTADRPDEPIEAIESFDLSDLHLSDRDSVVVATQGQRDREALQHALTSHAGYVGMVGSRAKIAKLTDDLGEGVPADRLAVLHGPAGLPIGAIDPEEIALSILAEIVKERRTSIKSANAQIDVESGVV